MKKPKKKSQIKMMETISVLMIFLILLAFVLIFYISFSKASNPKARDEKANLKAIEISQFASYMPELQCSRKNIIEENCFDIEKINVFKDYTENDPDGQKALNTIYYDVFEESRVTIHQYYPEGNSWVIYERIPTKTKVESRQVFIPVNLFDPNNGGSFSYGMLNVTVYS